MEPDTYAGSVANPSPIGKAGPRGVWGEVGRQGGSLALSACWLPGTVLLERRSVNILLSSQERKLTQAELPSAGHWPQAQYSMRPLSVKGGLFVLLQDGARAQSHQACHSGCHTEESAYSQPTLCLCSASPQANALEDQELASLLPA